jgi:hypothetical protein
VRQVLGVRDHGALQGRRVNLGAQVGPRDLEVLLSACKCMRPPWIDYSRT